MHRARAAVDFLQRVRRGQDQRLAPCIDPACEKFLEKAVDAAMGELLGTHTRKAGNHIELQIPVRKVAPSRDQDLMRKEVLDLALQPEKQLNVAPDELRFFEDTQQPLPLSCGERKGLRFRPRQKGCHVCTCVLFDKEHKHASKHFSEGRRSPRFSIFYRTKCFGTKLTVRKLLAR